MPMTIPFESQIQAFWNKVVLAQPMNFFQYIAMNMLPSDSFMSTLYDQLWYSTGEFQAFQVIVLVVFGTVD